MTIIRAQWDSKLFTVRAHVLLLQLETWDAEDGERRGKTKNGSREERREREARGREIGGNQKESCVLFVFVHL